MEGGRALSACAATSSNPDSRGFCASAARPASEVIGNPGAVAASLVRDRRDEPPVAPLERRAGPHRRRAGRRGGAQATALWPGHRTFTTNYGTRVNAQLFARFANFHGSQFLNPDDDLPGPGAPRAALTGMQETHTKEDMGEHPT